MSLWDYFSTITPKFIFGDYPLHITDKHKNCHVVIMVGIPENDDNERVAGLLGRDPIEMRLEKAKALMRDAIFQLIRETNKIHFFILSGIDLNLKIDEIYD